MEKEKEGRGRGDGEEEWQGGKGRNQATRISLPGSRSSPTRITTARVCNVFAASCLRQSAVPSSPSRPLPQLSSPSIFPLSGLVMSLALTQVIPTPQLLTLPFRMPSHLAPSSEDFSCT